ncbi:glycoside hydrolase family 1 protein [Metabacillus halosaccharovorans]|uniref:glycoside hydrolase family 1 protein n=1 Tax=Metabacillus halosaccharovorans TaxID=930124 RepID=UPI00203CFBBE|nr:family 1 glycosylhydrolase [Metabacillus halosaccharovorans]MCM3444251.1 family 1 glycosylhydrolase [Metabacillus halosaccharovorans]
MNHSFPQQFIWGSATAAYQVEGNNVNSDFWAEEHAEGSPYKDKSGDTIDHYSLYKKDIELMAKLGFKAYRFSIEWARIEPAKGHFSVSAILHYKDVLETCHAYGMTPVVALHHFSSPQWLMREGGWNNPEIPKLFANYCEVVIKELGHLIPYVLTMNEVNLPVMLKEIFSKIGFVPPVGIDRESWVAPKWRQSAATLCGADPSQYFTFHMISDEKSIKLMKEAHKQSRAVIKKIHPETKVGFSMALPHIDSIPGGELLAKEKWNSYFLQFLDMMEEDDFFGLQNYTREIYGPNGQIQPDQHTEVTQMGYEYHPEALGKVVEEVAKSVTIPIMVTENGIATANDKKREEFIQRALTSLHACIENGIEVIGYLHWSTFDNFEWQSGYGMQFGLIEVDRNTQERIPKNSAFLLGKVAKENKLTANLEVR